MFYLKSTVLVFLLFFIAGCNQDEPATSETSDRGDTVSIAGIDSSLKDGYTSGGAMVAEGYGMTYSDTALDEIIPALPIFGFANGQPINAGTVVFRQDHEGVWHLELSDHPFDPVKGIAFARTSKKDIQTIYITLPNVPATDMPMGREMEYGEGYFQIKKSPESQDTTSWNASFTYKIEVDEWEMGPAKVDSCGRPEIGKASGKLFISFKGSEERIKSSWVSGEFNNAAILYCGI